MYPELSNLIGDSVKKNPLFRNIPEINRYANMIFKKYYLLVHKSYL